MATSLIRLLLPPAAILIIATASGCHREHPPLGFLSGVTRVKVMVNYGHGDSTVILTDPRRISAITDVVNHETDGWHDVWDTQPAGDLAAQFFRRDSSLGVIWIGPQFLAERGRGPRLLRKISASTEIQLRHLLTNA